MNSTGRFASDGVKWFDILWSCISWKRFTLSAKRVGHLQTVFRREKTLLSLPIDSQCRSHGDIYTTLQRIVKSSVVPVFRWLNSLGWPTFPLVQCILNNISLITPSISQSVCLVERKLCIIIWLWRLPGNHDMSPWFDPGVCTHSDPTLRCPRDPSVRESDRWARWVDSPRTKRYCSTFLS